MKRKGRIKQIVLSVVLVVLFAASLVGNWAANHWKVSVNTYLGTSSYKVVDSGGSEDTQYFKSDFATVEDLAAHEKQVAAQVEGEGAVLLTNNGALPPLDTPAKENSVLLWTPLANRAVCPIG